MQSKEKVYSKFTGRSRLDKAINSLTGLIEGVAIDGVINPTEIGLLNAWLAEHREHQNKHPFNELIPVINRAVSDGVLDDEERQDILWLSERLRSTDFYDEITAGLQVLHGILGGIAADGQVTKEELEGLSAWLEDHDYLRTCYPYDEVDSVITSVLRDGRVDAEEQKMLQGFFGEFLALLDDRTITSPVVSLSGSIQGVCASQPVITFEGSVFCFTGESSRLPRKDLAALVESLGGIPSPSVTKKLDYLVIGAEGNPCWAYACYGRKVERAIELRKQGVRLLIVHEHDFHDAVADA
jgi:hypothetical protein